MRDDLVHDRGASQVKVLNGGREAALCRIVQEIVRTRLSFIRPVEIGAGPEHGDS